MRRGGRRWPLTTLIGLGFFAILIGALLAYEHVVFRDGPELLAGRAIGAQCEDSEECRAPLGSATRRALPKACAITGNTGICTLECTSTAGCPASTECAETTHREGGTTLAARLCVPSGRRDRARASDR